MSTEKKTNQKRFEIVMKLLWKLSKEAVRYRALYVVAILATLSLTCVNLAALRVLAVITGLIGEEINAESLSRIGTLTIILTLLYLSRIAFRFMSSYFSHKAAWYLVGDLMSRVINDTRDFELRLSFFYSRIA